MLRFFCNKKARNKQHSYILLSWQKVPSVILKRYPLVIVLKLQTRLEKQSGTYGANDSFKIGMVVEHGS